MTSHCARLVSSIRPWRLSLVMLALAGALLAGVPGLRDFWGALSGTERRWVPTVEQVDEVLHRHPGDPQILLAAALHAEMEADALTGMFRRREPSPGEVRAARERVRATRQAALRAPGAGPASWFALALILLGPGSIPTPSQRDYPNPMWRPVPVTARERANVRAALGLLRQTAKQDPDNAPVRYLLAILHLAQRNDAAAWRELAAAERAPKWDDYQGDRVLALRRLYGEMPSLRPWATTLAGSQSGLFLHAAPMRALGRLLTLQADAKRQAGDHSGALSRYRSTLLLGCRLRRDAPNVIDALMGQAIMEMAGHCFLSAEERNRFRNSDPRDDWVTRQHRAEAEAFARYARAHGEAELGRWAVSETEAMADFSERIKAALERQRSGPLVVTSSILGKAVSLVPYQLAPVSAWLAAWGLVLGLARLRGRRPVSVPLRPWVWGVLLLAFVAANIALAVWYSSGGEQRGAEGEGNLSPAWVEVVLAGTATGLLWGLALSLVARVAVHRERREDGVMGTPSAAASAAFHAIPLTAAAVLYGVALLLLVYVCYLYQGHEVMQMAVVGELDYLGITPR